MGLRSLLLLLLILPAVAGKKKGRKAEASAPVEAPKPPPPPPQADALWDAPLPLDHGPLPAGLANDSAQGCHACHVGTYADWSSSAHARGVTPALTEAAEAAGSPACLTCHLPLQAQHAVSFRVDGADVAQLATAPNPGWSPTLAAEGVTCAACHLRDGEVVGPTPATAAPHARGWSAELSDPATCAACHQLTWPGATEPFYDTYGAWQASAWATAGVTCQDCHMGPGAGETAARADHTMPADLGRALSILVELPEPSLVRGAEPVEARVVLQNTGAGHHVPSGSPHTALRVDVVLVGPDAEVPVQTARLGQVVGDAAPWPLTDDTRIPAGGTREIPLVLALDQGVDAGTWRLEVRLTRTVRDVPDPVPELVRAVSVGVE